MPMSDGGCEGGATVEGRWGCIASAILGMPVFMVLLFADALGDCAPDTACKKGSITQVLLPTAIVGIGVGLLVHRAVKAAKRKEPD